jgi:DNA-binding transcriptional LysR family regulator
VDLDALRLFVRASELRSFSKAAVSLGVAQPTVSRIIGNLEREWGGPLFYRTGRGVALSELGEEALTRARALLDEAERVGEDLRNFSRLPSGLVSVALPPSTIDIVLPPLLNQLRSERPGIRLRIHEGFSDQVERWLAEGTVDIGMYSKYWEGKADRKGLFLQSRLILAGAPGHAPLPAEIDFSRLAEFPLVLPPPTNGLRAIVDAIARRMRFRLQVIVDADSIVAQKAMTAACGCFMIKAPHTIADEQARRIFVTSVIRRPYINRHLVIATGHQKPLSRAAREVANRITEILRQTR